jgi:hypothetical protein
MSWADARGGGRGSGPAPHYRTAQVCLNGHPVTEDTELSPQRMSNFCAICGSATITTCPGCNAPIRGRYFTPNALVLSSYHPPSFCHERGKPMPWTAQAIAAAHELTDESDLSADDKQTLKSAIVELTVDTPKTELASIRYKKLLAKAGPAIGSAMNKIVVTVATEAVKKAMGI